MVLRPMRSDILTQVLHAVTLYRQYIEVRVEPKRNSCRNVEKPWLNSFRERISARRALAGVSMQCKLLIRRGNFEFAGLLGPGNLVHSEEPSVCESQ